MFAEKLGRTNRTREILHMTGHIRASDKTNITGDLGEQLFKILLADNWLIKKPEDYHNGDFVITDTETGLRLKVEIKTSKRGKHGFNFQLKKNDKHGVTDCSDSDILVLICIDKAGNPFAYVIPCEIVGGIKKISIRNHPTKYTGKYQKWYQRKPINPILVYDILEMMQ